MSWYNDRSKFVRICEKPEQLTQFFLQHPLLEEKCESERQRDALKQYFKLCRSHESIVRDNAVCEQTSTAIVDSANKLLHHFLKESIETYDLQDIMHSETISLLYVLISSKFYQDVIISIDHASQGLIDVAKNDVIMSSIFGYSDFAPTEHTLPVKHLNYVMKQAARSNCVQYMKHLISASEVTQVMKYRSLNLAITQGHLDIVRLYVENNFVFDDVVEYDEIEYDSITHVLRTCVKASNVDILRYLVDNNAINLQAKRQDINDMFYGNLFEMPNYGPMFRFLVTALNMTKDELDPMIVAAVSTDYDVFKFLLEMGCELPSQEYYPDYYHRSFGDRTGRTAAYFVETLGVAYNALDESGKPALFSAAMYANAAAIKFLVQRGANVNESVDISDESIYALDGVYADLYTQKASVDDRYDTVKALLDAGFNIRSSINKALLSACGDKDNAEKLVKLLLDAGADALYSGTIRNSWGDESEGTPMSAAMQYKHAGIIKALLDKGAILDPTLFDMSSLLYDSNKEMMELAASANIIPNMENVDYYTVSDCRDIEVLKLFIKHFFVYMTDKRSKVLTSLIERDDLTLELFISMVSTGIDLHEKDEYSNQMLYFSLVERCKSADIINYILSIENIDVNAADSYGTTLLSYCISSGNYIAVKALVERGADLRDRYNTSLATTLCSSSYNCTPSVTAVDCLKAFIARGLKVNEEENGLTLLHLCCSYGSVEIAKFLIEEAGADVHAVNSSEQNALSIALSVGKQEIIALLMEHGLDVKAVDATGTTMLMNACSSDNPSMKTIEILLSNNIDINAINAYNETALIKAAVRGHYSIFKYLESQGAILHPEFEQDELYFTASIGCYDLVEYLLEKNIYDVNKVAKGLGQTPMTAYLRSCSYNKQPEEVLKAVKLFIKHGGDASFVNEYGETCLDELVRNTYTDNTPAVELLIENGANVQKALARAICGKKEILELLMMNGACVNDDVDEQTGYTLLHHLCVGSSQPETLIESFDFLFSNGFSNINAVAKDGRTALCTVCNLGSYGMKAIEAIVDKYGADVSIGAPLVAAVSATYDEERQLLDYLIEKGANLNAKDNYYRYTPLEAACTNNRQSLFDYLLEKGADLSQSPGCLVRAVSAHYDQSFDFIKVLVQKGCSITYVAEDFGYSAIEYAIYSKKLDIIKYFIEECHLDISTQPNLLCLAYESEEIFEYLLSQGCDINTRYVNRPTTTPVNEEDRQPLENDGCTPLLYACGMGATQRTIQYIIDKGADIRAENDGGCTMLHFMVSTTRFTADFVQSMIDRGLDVHKRDKKGRTPYMYSLLYDATAISECLLKNGARTDDMDLDGKNCLHFAAIQSNSKAVSFLVSKGVDINSKDNNGDTPLSLVFATSSRTYTAITLFAALVDAGAELNMTVHSGDNKGKLLVDLAASDKNTQLLALFAKHGIQPSEATN